MIVNDKLSATIDQVNDRFTGTVKSRLAHLSSVSDDVLEWLVMEHYQFSFVNCEILQKAAVTTGELAEKGVATELRRNLAEENGHAVMYKRAMREIGTDFDTHEEFAPTTQFLDELKDLSQRSPSIALGALYATETAAIFEHEVFFDISRELCERRQMQWPGSLIKKFHDIHLDEGVEQGHKDGLAQFVDLIETPAPESGAIDSTEVLTGAVLAIETMREWWEMLLRRARISADPVAV